MEKLTRNEMKNVKGGASTPPGGGTGGSGGTGGGGGGTNYTICKFVSATTCGTFCYDIGSTAPCSSVLPSLNPSCAFTAYTVTSCAAA